MKIEWAAEAAAELDDILSYIAAQNPSAAALIAERAVVAEERIQQFPRAGKYDAETDTHDRFIPNTRIVLTYAIQGETVWIITTWHTSRDPETKPISK